MTKSEHTPRVLSLQDFRAQQNGTRNASAPSNDASAVAGKMFVAFNMVEQEAIMRLHARFSAASRDYRYDFRDGYAAITLLACCFTRETLARFSKTAEDGEAPRFAVEGSAVSAFKSASLDEVIAHSCPGLQQRADEEHRRHAMLARRAAFKRL